MPHRERADANCRTAIYPGRIAAVHGTDTLRMKVARERSPSVNLPVWATGPTSLGTTVSSPVLPIKNHVIALDRLAVTIMVTTPGTGCDGWGWSWRVISSQIATEKRPTNAPDGTPCSQSLPPMILWIASARRPRPEVWT
jgi:hypothetical protein